ncbi:MAG: UDP-N-acetylglucosamine--N-acetylmuramyl-(pentapeptide) pyrophosphoryl-undecaprenol N-acetylglucosamine transferase [Anaerolineae bacterium]|nr:UDP-N-acetylglucosamine--N-acetylmuramyl-(pentapeptide) pyrophosphoryl-undecaprenol N-acetylglucosamine transferase [Anaerolineae bacterium]
MMIAAGGTGGHVYPAIAVAEAINAHRPDVELTFVGSVGGFERPLLDEAALKFDHYAEVHAGPLHGVGVLRASISVAKLIVGTLQALWLIFRHRPRALFLTGGWVGWPVALAGWMLRVPSLIYLPDVEPGLAIKALRPFVTRVATTTDASAVYFRSGHTVVTGYPVRRSMLAATRDAALAHFRLDPAKKTLLVFGGSRGARSINNAVIDIAPQLLADGIQIIHLTGTLDWEQIAVRRAQLGDGCDDYHAFPYLHEDMALALASADLVVCRSGASVLGELPLFGLPSVLVPYPYAWRYQKVNADYLVERGAGVLLRDEAMPGDLLPTLRGLLGDPARLDAMHDSAAALAQPEGAWNVARELLRLAGDDV